jgi:hypothetical protein
VINNQLCFGLCILASSDDKIFKPFKFRMEEIEGFRYRAQDALRAVTKTSGKSWYHVVSGNIPVQYVKTKSLCFKFGKQD